MEKTIIYDRNEIKSFKDFYEKIYIDLEGSTIPYWSNEQCKYLGYSADILDEFLWYCHDDKIHFILRNFDLDKIKQQKTFEDYKINLIIEVLQESVEKYKDFSLTIE
ncbi:MAG: hypothetical protein IJ538_03495 [Clostridia bacterium]|nr:hypothetical protein [Clostridia bacterium]